MPSSFSRVTWMIRRQLRKVRVKVTIFALFGLATAAAAYFFKDVIPDDLSAKVGADSVQAILQVLASSMLAVTTFSLSILTAAYANAAGNSSPRAVTLLVEDGFSQTVLATFMGAFVFSIVGIAMLQTGVYGRSGRLILFAATLFVVAVVVAALLRWISNLADLGRVGDNLDRIERAAADSLIARLKEPYCGGQPLLVPPPSDVTPVSPNEIGYIQHVGYAELSRFADENELDLYLTAMAGDFVTPGAPILFVRGMPANAEEAAKLTTRLLAGYVIEQSRSFDQDPRFGITVLSEVGQRALSPGINDPGTAEEAMTRITRVLGAWNRVPHSAEISFPRLWVPPLRVGELLQDGFAPLARDGAANFQVQFALQTALLALARICPPVFATGAQEVSALAQRHAEPEIPIQAQRDQLERLADQIAQIARQNPPGSGATTMPQP